MARSFWLWDARYGHDVAHAHFTLEEQVQDSEPGTVRERLKHPIDGWCAPKLYSPKRI
jgi:hypothetical protein